MSSTRAPAAPTLNHHPTSCGELYPAAVDLERVRAAHRPLHETRETITADGNTAAALATLQMWRCILFAGFPITPSTKWIEAVAAHLAGPGGGKKRVKLMEAEHAVADYLVGAAATPLAGHWIDARGHRFGVASGVAIGLAGALTTLVPSLPAVVVGLAMVATGVFISQATASSFIGSVTADDRGLAVGLYSTCYYMGGSLGAALPALIWTRGGWPACVALVVAVQLTTVMIARRFWADGRGASAPLPETGL